MRPGRDRLVWREPRSRAYGFDVPPRMERLRPAKNAASQATKRVVRRLVGSQGFDIVPRASTNGPELDVLSLLIELCTLKHGRGTLVQIGANDGVLEDPVREILVRLDLPALLVEPLPDLFERLRQNYASQDNVQFANVAVGTASGSADIFRVSPTASHLPDWMHGLASFDKAVLLKHQDWAGVPTDFAEHIEQVSVPVVTIRELLDSHTLAAPVLVLQVDTEGHDYEVLRSAVAADCLPALINYEHKHLSLSDQAAARDLLAANGYSFLRGADDTIAVREAGALESP